MIRKSIILFTLLLISTVLLAASDSHTRWNISYDNVDSLDVDDSTQKAELKSGWSCVIGETSINKARQTSCRKANEAIEFSVQCDVNRPKDHAQVRFGDVSGKYIDFIEVSCEQV